MLNPKTLHKHALQTFTYFLKYTTLHNTFNQEAESMQPG